MGKEGKESGKLRFSKILEDEIMGRHAGAIYFPRPANAETDAVEILSPEFFDDVTDAIVASST